LSISTAASSDLAFTGGLMHDRRDPVVRGTSTLPARATSRSRALGRTVRTDEPLDGRELPTEW
jgi:hypothetical protein